MHPFKVAKLRTVNTAMNAIYADYKAFKKSIGNLNMAGSKVTRHKLSQQRQIDVQFAYDSIQGFQFIITAFFGTYGQVNQTYHYCPIHSDISTLFGYAYDLAVDNFSAAYSRSEKAFTGC